MKKVIYLGVLMALTVFVTGAFAQEKMKSDSKMSGKKSADSSFMMMAATGGMNEISLSNQALTKSSNDDVKSFAQKMVVDHTKAGDELKQVAMSKNVTLPNEPDAKHKKAAAKMSSMSGAAFDKDYIKTMVKDHEKTVAMFQKEINSGKDADAKAFAQKTLPTIQEHLEMARGLMSKMMGGKMSNSMKSSE